MIVAVAAPALVLGCAAMTSGTEQEISVVTEPAGASCEVERNATLLGVVSSTPGRLTVTKSPNTLTVRCRKPGFEPASGFLFASFQDRTYLGGAIGVLIDYQSGAINQYPSSITLTLMPTEFETAEARDGFFAKLASQTRERAAREIASLRDETPACKATPQQGACADAIKAVEEQLAAELEQIEQRRRRARIVGQLPG